MKQLLKKVWKRSVKRLGLKVTDAPKPEPAFSVLEIMLQGFIGCQGTINIVQIGANDGKHGDPINRVLMRNKESIKALLIEPQEDILEYLKTTYADHPNITLHNGAIGNNEYLAMYRIRPHLRSAYKAPYLKDAPSYRAASGLTSSSRSHVIDNAKRYLDPSLSAEEAVEEFRVPCSPLPKLLEKVRYETRIHLLQIDTEGTDDEVIYACGIPEVKPVSINYESKHLGEERKVALEAYLRDAGYGLYKWKSSDTLAILSEH